MPGFTSLCFCCCLPIGWRNKDPRGGDLVFQGRSLDPHPLLGLWRNEGTSSRDSPLGYLEGRLGNLEVHVIILDTCITTQYNCRRREERREREREKERKDRYTFDLDL